ncbi:hypothetical protein [Streptosporangium sp. H16]|uniref:hypothetical protein n=1 Tax=Streptosporangium sp. H16 TaxID=3444184 RepID=UPI003F791C9F
MDLAEETEKAVEARQSFQKGFVDTNLFGADQGSPAALLALMVRSFISNRLHALRSCLQIWVATTVGG